MGAVAAVEVPPTPEERLAARGWTLPPLWAPGASLLMARAHGDLLRLSAHMGVQMDRPESFHGREDHRPLRSGRVGAEVSLEEAVVVARGGALNVIATLRHELGDLRRVRAFLQVTVLVNAVDGFWSVHTIADAASDVFIDVFGPAGQHARSSFGVTALPANSCLAVEALVSLEPPSP